MKKLSYIKTSDLSIDINLGNGYFLRASAKYNYISDKYELSFYIREKTIDKYMAIETLNNKKVLFDGNRKTIKTNILHYVSVLLSKNYFNDSIKHYEYELKCFDIGHELIEEQNRINRNANPNEGGVA